MNISANAVTVVRGFFIIYACYCFWTGEYIFFLQGSIILALNILFDFVDGDLARLHHNESDIGEWLETITDQVISDISALAGFFITFGIYKITGELIVWWVLFFIIYAHVLNIVFSTFYCHEGEKVDKLKRNFQLEYDKFMKKSIMKKLYFTIYSFNEFIILFMIIFYGPIERIFSINPLFLAMIIICILYQFRWLARLIVQAKYFLSH